MVHQQGQQQCGLQTLCNHEDVTLQAALLPVHCLFTHHLWASAWSLIQHNRNKNGSVCASNAVVYFNDRSYACIATAPISVVISLCVLSTYIYIYIYMTVPKLDFHF